MLVNQENARDATPFVLQLLLSGKGMRICDLMPYLRNDFSEQQVERAAEAVVQSGKARKGELIGQVFYFKKI